MASAKLIIKTSKAKQLKDGTFPIALQIIVNRKAKEYRIGYSCYEQFWDKKTNGLKSGKVKHPNYKAFSTLLFKKITDVMDVIMTIETENEGWNHNDFENIYFNKVPSGESFFDFIDVHIKYLSDHGRVSDCSNFRSVRKNVMEFTKNKDLVFADITVDWLSKLQQNFKTRGKIGRNVLKDIRTLYNAAIRQNIAKKENYPFGLWGFKLPRIKKQEKGLSMNEVKMLIEFSSDDHDMMNALKYWLLMFYCIGMEWKDLCLLKVENVKNGRLEFERSKTGRFFTIALSDPAKQIINALATGKDPGDFLFNIIPGYVAKKPDREFYYAKVGRDRVNRKLKRIATALEINKPLSTKVARYTWASIARNELNVTTELIQDGLGHSDIKVTQGYTNTRENKAVDDLNSKMVDLLF